MRPRHPTAEPHRAPPSYGQPEYLELSFWRAGPSHPGEMARLAKTTTPDIQADRKTVALDAARRWGAVVALKGAHTVVAAPDGRLSVDPHAVPAMASGGTGDVLAGLIGALLAQGGEPFEATVTGVYVHAAAGRLASVGSSGLLASELLPAIPQVMELLRGLNR